MTLIKTIMYVYEGSPEQMKRLAKGICRCQSSGEVHNLPQLIRHDRICVPPEMTTPLSTSSIRRFRTDPAPEDGGYGKTYIFAISRRLEIHIAPDSDRSIQNAVKHETLFHNADVLAAGEICIRDGVIVAINDHSGSYGTLGELEVNPEFADAVMGAIKSHQLPIDDRLLEELTALRKMNDNR